MKLHQKIFWLLVLLLPVQLGRHFWPDFSLVLGLKIDYLSPTFYLTDLLVLLVLFFWLVTDFKKSKPSWLIGAFFLFLLVNAFLAQNQGAAFYKLFKIIEFSGLAFYVAKNKITLSFLSLPLFLGMAFSSLLALFQFIGQSSLNGPFWWLGERTFNMSSPGIAKAIVNGRLLMRPYATFSHPNALAGFLLVGLILTSGFWLKKNKRLVLGLTFLIILALALSFSRSAWVVGLLAAGYFLWFSKVIKKRFWVWLILVLLIFVLTSFAYFSTNEAFFQRTQLMKSAWLMIKDFPLAGVGLNNFIVRLPEYWSLIGFTYWLQPVHNLFLLLAAETGFTGLLIFLWFLILTYRRASYLKANRFLFLIAISAILLLGLTDHYWLTLQQNQLLLTLLIGLVWSSQS